MPISETAGAPVIEAHNLGQWTIERILEWSGICARFLDWEREHMLLREPSAQDLAEHEQALKWLLRITKLYHAAVSDPEFPDQSAVKELHGRLLQLESSWRMFHNPLRKEEAEKLLGDVFPDER